MFEVLWESKEGIFESIDCKIRIVKFEEKEYYMEILTPNVNTWWERVKMAWKLIFNNAKVSLSVIPIREKELKRMGLIDEEQSS